MDAQGGEKIETMTELFGALASDARARGLLRDELYFLSDSVLATFKQLQGFDAYTPFPGCRLEQAHGIWNQCPQHLFSAVLKAGLQQIVGES